jgi:hypothetical protein
MKRRKHYPNVSEKIMQVKESISINRSDTSISKSERLDYAIPPSKISGLSSGEFLGMLADDPHEKIRLKVFHCEINCFEKDICLPTYGNVNKVNHSISSSHVDENYQNIRRDIALIIEKQIQKIT